MAIERVSNFLEHGLPKILKGRTSLRCMFTTYREVEGFRDGEVVTNKPNLLIRVSQGRDPSLQTLLPLFAGLGPDSMRREARSQLSKVIEASDIPKEDVNFLLVTYAGASAFEETINFVREVRERCPMATIVVVTCDCDIVDKTADLGPHLRDGTIDFATYGGPHCGGHREMAAILNSIIAAWPIAGITLSSRSSSSTRKTATHSLANLSRVRCCLHKKSRTFLHQLPHGRIGGEKRGPNRIFRRGRCAFYIISQ